MEDFNQKSIVLPLHELNYQVKYLARKNMGFWGGFRASIFSWEHTSFIHELEVFNHLYIKTLKNIAEINIENPDKSTKEYIDKKIKEFPEFDIDLYKTGIKSYLMLIIGILFFPILFVLMFQSFKKMYKFKILLDQINLLSNNIIRVCNNPKWTKYLVKKEVMN